MGWRGVKDSFARLKPLWVGADGRLFYCVKLRDFSLQPCHRQNRREGKVKISLKAIILIAFALIISVALMIAVWKIIGKLDSDDKGDDNSP